MLGEIIATVIRRLVILGVLGALFLAVVLVVGHRGRDTTVYPGMANFQLADNQINMKTKSLGLGQGNSQEAQMLAKQFASTIKPLRDLMFSKGGGKTMLTGGEFLTYCHLTPEALVFLVHVPELRNYKDPKVRESLAELAWTCAKMAAKDLPANKRPATLAVGLRGIASYGPIWIGSGTTLEKTDSLTETKRLYPFFITPGQ